MPNIDLSILNQRQTPAFYADVFANRPAAGFVGRIFVSTNTFAFYRDNGTSWDLIGGPGTGTVTGTGANGQVTYWNGASTITGSNDLFWDAVNGHFGIGTNVPGTALDVHHDQPTVAILNQTVATNDVRIGFQNNGVGLWRIGAFYNAGANDFGIYDAVAAIQPVTVKRTTGQVLIGTSTVGSGKLVVASATGDNGIQIVGANAPSLRIDNAESGPTKRAGFGISTATNNFIQGSADRDFCMFNGSTTASPILFGVYDAGASNVQEAARISAARNFLLGTSVDAGYKLAVSGSSNFTQTSNGATIEVLRLTNSGAGANTQAKLQFNAAGTNYSSISGGYGSSAPQLTYDVPFGNHVFTGSAISAQCDLGVVGLVATSSRLVINGAIDDAVTALQVSGSGKFSSGVSVNGLATSANYKLGASGRAYFSGLNDKGLFISDSNSPAYVSLVGLNSAISTYNNVELRASGTDGQLYLTTAGNIVVNSTTDNGQRFQVNGNIQTNGTLVTSNGAIRTYGAVGDVVINISGLQTLNGNFWGQAGGTIFYTGVGTDLSNSTTLFFLFRLQGLGSWSSLTITDISGTSTVALSNASTTGCTLTIDCPPAIYGSAIVQLTNISGGNLS